MSSEKVKWLVFYDGQYQFKVLLMLDADFESILKPADEKYIEKINQMKTKQKGKTPCTEKINTHLPSDLCVQNTLTYGDVLG